MNELALFAGTGGGILGGHLLGWRTVCAVELNPYAASILAQRQNDGLLESFPIWDDVCTFDGRLWRGLVDVVSGGFPCQDISIAGGGAGITGERSGLWKEFARIIGEVRPRFVIVENSPALTFRGIDVVLGDLASLGYDAEWGVLGASDAGAPHRRERIWICCRDTKRELADANLFGRVHGQAQEHPTETKQYALGESKPSSKDVAYSNSSYGERVQQSERSKTKPAKHIINRWWDAEPDVGRVAHGVAARVDRLKAIGNGQVPAVVRLAWSSMMGVK